MRTITRPLGSGLFLVACLLLGTSFGIAQQGLPTKAPRYTGHYLPSGWKKVGVTKEQAAKVYAIQDTFKAKKEAARRALTVLQAQERAAMTAILNAEQLRVLRQLSEGAAEPEPTIEFGDGKK